MFKKELKQFREFRKTFKFNEIKTTEKNGAHFFGAEMVQTKDGELISSGKGFINVGYKAKGLSRTLSNLYPYEFRFKGKNCASIEAVFQGIKFPNKKEQNLILKMSGMDCYYSKFNSDYDWRETGIVFWQGKPIDRHSKEYADFVDELYISAIQNPLYRKAILNTGDLYIIHSLGNEDAKDTVLSKREYETMLNSLKAFLQSKK